MWSNLMTVTLGASLALGACATKAQTGAATGAVAGGALGAAIGDTTGLLIGAALGGLIGHEVGRQMDREDQRRIAYALEANEAMRWENPNTGYQYEVRPTDTRYERGLECREFRMLADDRSSGRPEEVHGTACRQPDGTWELLSG